MGSIETAFYCSGWGHSKSLHTKLLLNRPLLRALPAGSWKPTRTECTAHLGSLCPYLMVATMKLFPLKSEPPCMTTAFHPAAIYLRKEFCSIFLINSSTRRKLLHSPPGLLAGCPDNLTRDFSMFNAAGLPVPSPVSCLCLLIGLPRRTCAICSLVSVPFSYMDLVSVSCCSWLDFLAEPWTCLVISPCSWTVNNGITSPVLPKSWGHCPACTYGELPSWSSPALLSHDIVHQFLQSPLSMSPQCVLGLFHLR